MSWLALHRSEELFALLGSDLKAFGLLTLIAARARYHPEPCPITKLQQGEARIGDHESCGLTRKEYRNALTRLEKMSIISTKRANTGTIARLCNSSIYSLTQEPEGQQRANEGPTKGQQGATNNKVTRKEGNTEELFPVEILPNNWRSLTITERNRIKVNFNNPLMIRIGKWFRQKETTLWTIAEYLALEQVSPTEEDLDLIGEHYSYEIEKNGYRYTTISILLNNWSSARSKANLFFEENRIPRTA